MPSCNGETMTIVMGKYHGGREGHMMPVDGPSSIMRHVDGNGVRIPRTQLRGTTMGRKGAAFTDAQLTEAPPPDAHLIADVTYDGSRDRLIVHTWGSDPEYD